MHAAITFSPFSTLQDSPLRISRISSSMAQPTLYDEGSRKLMDARLAFPSAFRPAVSLSEFQERRA